MEQILQLSLYDAIDKEMKEYQKQILLSRMYYNGYQPVSLSGRQSDFLSVNPSNPYSLNVCRIVANTLTDELVLLGFETSEGDNKKDVSEFLGKLYKNNKVDIYQSDLYTMSIVDRESFLILDWSDIDKMPTWVIHESYTSNNISAWDKVGYGVTSELIEKSNGTGKGVYVKYINNDRMQGIEFAVQYWYKEDVDNKGDLVVTHRRTIYYPERIERQYYDDGHWVDAEESQKWVMPNGDPIGVPVICFPNKDLKCEFWDAMSLQDIINQTLADNQASLNMYGFRLMFLFGADVPTTDGQPAKSDGSNVMVLKPGFLAAFSEKPASEVSVQVIEAQDPTPIINELKDLIVLVAQTTGTPTTKFTSTAQVASAETLREQKDSLNKRANKVKSIWSDSWRQVAKLSIRMYNAFGNGRLDELVDITPIWSTSFTIEELQQQLDIGLPKESIWLKMGYSQEKIEEMKNSVENKIEMARKFYEGYNSASISGVSIIDYARFVGLPEEDIKLLTQTSELIPTDE